LKSDLSEKLQTLQPHVSLGIEAYEFNSKYDMYDAYGNEYHYWSDGTIRNVEENSSQASQSVIIQRDYDYETDLREMDNDDLGKYPLFTFSIPVDLGVELFITDRVLLLSIYVI